jgi:cytosine/adenosine deaminase-related metal-dependent hydrolase
VGRIAPGWAADLQVIEADTPTPLADHNLLEQLLLWRNHTDVRAVMVAGVWQMEEGELLGVDLERIRARVAENASRMWRGLGG